MKTRSRRCGALMTLAFGVQEILALAKNVENMKPSLLGHQDEIFSVKNFEGTVWKNKCAFGRFHLSTF